jgi:hypothetical protein
MNLAVYTSNYSYPFHLSFVRKGCPPFRTDAPLRLWREPGKEIRALCDEEIKSRVSP